MQHGSFPPPQQHSLFSSVIIHLSASYSSETSRIHLSAAALRLQIISTGSMQYEYIKDLYISILTPPNALCAWEQAVTCLFGYIGIRGAPAEHKAVALCTTSHVPRCGEFDSFILLNVPLQRAVSTKS